MAKQGMNRSNPKHRPSKDPAAPVPELQGKFKHSKSKAHPIIAGTTPPAQKVFHVSPHAEKPISDVYSVIDTDLARDNLENDIPEPDLPD